MNHLADKNELELKALRGKKYSGEYNGGRPFPYKYINRDSLPTQFDWRIFGAVTPVKGKNHFFTGFSILPNICYFILQISLYAGHAGLSAQ